MSLTPEEIAMCMDAMLEAGVPQRVVEELVSIRNRLHKIGYVQTIDDRFVRAEPGFRYVRDKMYIELSKKLIEDGVAGISEDLSRFHVDRELRLELTVLTPPGWKPPTKEPR